MVVSTLSHLLLCTKPHRDEMRGSHLPHAKFSWDPGGPSYTSRSSLATDLEKLGQPKSYLRYIHLPGLSSLPFLVVLMLILAPKHHLGKLDDTIPTRNGRELMEIWW